MKAFLIASCLLMAANGATINRQARTLGLAETAIDFGTGIVTGTLPHIATAVGTAAKVGTGLLVGKTLLAGLGGKYALYRYLKNKHANDGLHIGGSAGFGLGGAGSKIPFGLPASIKTALGSSEPVWETVSQDYVSSPAVYETVAPVSYDFVEPAPVVYQVPAAQQFNFEVPAAPQQFNFEVPAAQLSFDSAPVVSFDNSGVDSYGAPGAPLVQPAFDGQVLSSGEWN